MTYAEFPEVYACYDSVMESYMRGQGDIVWNSETELRRSIGRNWDKQLIAIHMVLSKTKPKVIDRLKVLKTIEFNWSYEDNGSFWKSPESEELKELQGYIANLRSDATMKQEIENLGKFVWGKNTFSLETHKIKNVQIEKI